jgi:hypoxia up-regulated 1
LLSKDAIKDAKKRISALEKRDEDKLKNEQAKNDFETLIYGFRDWLNDSDNDQFITKSEKNEQLTNLETESEWLYDEGDDAGFKEYQKRGYEL